MDKSSEKFDIIVGDLADSVEGGPCYQLYTKSFYEKVLKPKLNHGGIFMTQVQAIKFLQFGVMNLLSSTYFAFTCRLDQQAFSPTKRSSPLYSTPSNKSLSVNLQSYIVLSDEEVCSCKF